MVLSNEKELKEIILKCLINYITIWFPMYFILYYCLFIFINQDADFISLSIVSGLIEIPLPKLLDSFIKTHYIESLLVYFVIFSFVFALDFWNYYFFKIPKSNSIKFRNSTLHEAKIIDHNATLEGSKFMYPVIYMKYKIGRKTDELYNSKIGYTGFIKLGKYYYLEYDKDKYQALFNRAYGKDNLDNYYFLFENGNPVSEQNYLFSILLSGFIIYLINRLNNNYQIISYFFITIYLLVIFYMVIMLIIKYMKKLTSTKKA